MIIQLTGCDNVKQIENECTKVPKLSYTTVVVYSRGRKAIGVAHEAEPPKNQPQFFQMTYKQYWLGKTKHNQAFRSARNAFNKLVRNFFKNLLNRIFY